jgi:hypothetical protein
MGPGMTTKSLAAALVIAFTCVLSASCLQAIPEADDTATPQSASTTPPASEPAEPIGEAPQASGRMPFGSKDFPFFTQIKDDGKDLGGGWQITHFAVHCVAGEGLLPSDEWDCPIEVGMPIRSSQIGRITPSYAALMTAEIVNAALPEQRASRADWTGLGAVFCRQLERRMEAMFKGQYPGCGAKMKRWLQ